MGFSIVSIVFAFAMIISCITRSMEAIDGYIAPLMHRTSQKHPLYNPNATPKDIAREQIRTSIARQRFLARQRLGLGRINGVAPISFDVVMSYSIGTPPVESLAVPDTGSPLIWQQCRPCGKCYDQTKPIFNPLKSTTYQLVDCKSRVCSKKFGFTCGTKGSLCAYKRSYYDGSETSGKVGTDSLTLPGNEYYPEATLSKTVFGCGNYNKIKFFHTGYSGVVGLQNTSISLARQFGGDSFSYCTSGEGGFIYFGKTARLSGSKTILFTDSFNTYQVILLGIAVGTPQNTSNLNISSDIFKMVKNKPNTGTTVDSGSTLTFLPREAFNALKRKIGDFMAKYESYRTTLYDVCYNGDDNPGVSVETMPSVHFVLDNMSLSFPNQNIWSTKNDDGDICLMILPSKSPLTTIGAEQLRDFNIGFDLRENLIWFNYEPACV